MSRRLLSPHRRSELPAPADPACRLRWKRSDLSQRGPGHGGNPMTACYCCSGGFFLGIFSPLVCPGARRRPRVSVRGLSPQGFKVVW